MRRRAVLAAAGRRAAFSPADLPDLHAWWKADSITGVDGDPVASWSDSSGNGYTGTQATAAAKPTLKTGVVNSRPVVRFDGGDSLATSASSSQTAVTFAAVVRPTLTSGNQSITQGSYNTLQWRLKSGKQSLLLCQVAEIGVGVNTVSATAFNVLVCTFTANSDYAYYLNGATDGAAATTRTPGGAGVAGIGGAFETLTGDIAELIICNSVLSSTNRGKVTSYLGTKYGITVT